MLRYKDVRHETFSFLCRCELDKLQIVNEDWRSFVEEHGGTLPLRAIQVFLVCHKSKVYALLQQRPDYFNDMWFSPEVGPEEFAFSTVEHRLLNAHCLVSIECADESAAGIVTRLYRQIPTYYTRRIRMPHVSNGSKLPTVRRVLSTLPVDFGICFDFDDEDLNQLMNSGFFQDSRIQQAKSVGFWLYPSAHPTCLDWDLFVERIVFGFPNSHLIMNHFMKYWTLKPEDDHYHNKVGEILLQRIVKRFLTAGDVSGLAKSLSLPLFARHDSLILDMKPSITNATPFFIRTRDYFAFFRESTDVYYVVNERLHETLTIINYKGLEKPDRGGFIVVVRGRVLTPYYDEFAV